MLSKFFGVKTKKEPNHQTTNSTSQFNGNQSALVKLKREEHSNIMNTDITESVIDKMEKKISNIKNSELFSRENQISKPVDEIIEVPKKKIKEEIYILSEDKKQNQIKQKLREKEAEEDKEKRKIESDIDKIKKKKLFDKFKAHNLKFKKKNIIKFGKILLLILLIYFAFICLLIFIERL